MPKPADQTGWPFWRTAREMPGTLLAVMKAETAFSICARFCAEKVESCASTGRQERARRDAARKEIEKRSEARWGLGIWRNNARTSWRESSAESVGWAGRVEKGKGWLDGKSGELIPSGRRSDVSPFWVPGEVVGEPGVRCGVLEQSGGLVWFGANRNPYRFACC